MAEDHPSFSRHIRLAREVLNIAQNMDECRQEDSVFKMEGWLREVSNLKIPKPSKLRKQGSKKR